MSEQAKTSISDDPRLLALSTVACSVPPGAGGLGRHFGEAIDLAKSLHPESFRYICPAPGRIDERHIRVPPVITGGQYIAHVPSSLAYGGFMYVAGVGFDLLASRKLPASATGYTAFASQALTAFKRARHRGLSLGLIAPNSHVQNIWDQQNAARHQYPVDRGWLTKPLLRRTIAEYQLADIIFITSEYQRQTFLDHGVEPEKLVRLDLHVSSRFQRRASQPSSDTFNICYVGRFDLIKGIPVLLDAFLAANQPDWTLTLMGQYCSSGIRRHIESRVAGDTRITICDHGDPLALLESAHVFVHPTFEDGFGYAPMEALAVGVPVIVTDQTGMAEYVQDGVNGSVFPAGDVAALSDLLRTYSGTSRQIPTD